MKRLLTFHEFVNESASINESKYANTYYENIIDAKSKDANWKKFREGKPLNRKGPMATPGDMERFAQNLKNKSDTVPFQREELQNNMSPDINWSHVPDKEIVKYMNDWKTRIMEDVKNSVAIKKIKTELERIHKNGVMRVSAHARVPEDLKIQFVLPIFTSQSDKKAALDFLIGTNEIEVKSQPTVVNKWEVEYSGNVKNDREETIGFDKVNNGLAVNLN